MKNKLGIILALSFLSITGIVLLQISWINNILILQKQQYDTEINKTLKDIKVKILQRTAINYGYNPSAINYDNSTIQNILLDQITNIPEEDVQSIIKRNLTNNGIKLDFEYAIIKNGLFLTNSLRFDPKKAQHAYYYSLNNDNSIQLILNIDFRDTYIIQRSIGMIAAALGFTFIILYAFYLTNTTLTKLKKLTTTTNDYFNNMTHEFKTPIATINLAADTLRSPKIQNAPEKQLFYLQMIKEENNRMLKLVQRILESAKSEESGIILSVDSINVHKILQHASESVILMLRNKDGDINLQLSATRYSIQGDEIHLTNIFNNLLDNAIKYAAPSRQPLIELKTYNQKHNLVIEIKDNGVGMSREALKYIFDRFYRVSTGNIHNVKGYGLGLSYVKSVVEKHSGTIKVDSVINKGSVFTITFPISETPASS